MKIGIYAPAKNEIANVDKWFESCHDADVISVSDTGSTDGTPARLRELGVKVTDVRIMPYRSDDSFNTALNLLPDWVDVAIRLDLDERLQPGWRAALEEAWQFGTTRLRYEYVWNWIAPGVPGKQWWGDRIHARANYRWRGVTHEALYSTEPEKLAWTRDVKIWQFDEDRIRPTQLPWLIQDAQENPTDARIHSYLAREYMYLADWKKCLETCERYFDLPGATWRVERAAGYIYMSRAYRGLKHYQDSLNAALKSTMEWGNVRETWLEVADAAMSLRDWPTVYWAAHKCLNIQEKTMSYIGDSRCWAADPYDRLAISAYYLGKYAEALENGLRALDFAPTDPRLQDNLAYYQSKS